MDHQQYADRADVAELADALDLGSSVNDMGVQVSSSAPIQNTNMREWLSGRALPCQGKCREFESRLPLQYAPLAQLVEQMTLNHWVQSSSL